MVKHKTCFKNKISTLLDVLLTNKVNFFRKTTIFEKDLSDSHKLVITILRSTFMKLPPKTITYRPYKNCNEKKVVHELDQKLIQRDTYKANNSYSKIHNY